MKKLCVCLLPLLLASCDGVWTTQPLPATAEPKLPGKYESFNKVKPERLEIRANPNAPGYLAGTPEDFAKGEPISFVVAAVGPYYLVQGAPENCPGTLPLPGQRCTPLRTVIKLDGLVLRTYDLSAPHMAAAAVTGQVPLPYRLFSQREAEQPPETHFVFTPAAPEFPAALLNLPAVLELSGQYRRLP